MKAKSIILIIIFQLLVSNSQAQFVFSKFEESIQNSILDLDFKSIQFNGNSTQNGILNWLKAYQLFLNYVTTIQNISPDSVIEEIEHQKAIIEDLNDDTPYYHYCIADIDLMICYLNYEKNNLIQAISNYWSAKHHITYNAKEFPDFQLNKKHLLITKTTDAWINETLFGKENESNEYWTKEFKNYWSEAKKHQKSGSVSYREIELVGNCLQLLFDQISPEKNIDYKLPNDFYALKGPLETFVTSMILGKKEQFDERLKVMEIADSLGLMQKYNLLNLLYGIARLNNAEKKSATYLQVFIKNQKNYRHTNYARLKLAWYFTVNHQPKSADSLVAIIRKSEQKDAWDDQQAAYEIAHAHEWVPEIILSRLNFDGGNYEASINILLSVKQSINSFNQSQKLEYAYRLARAYHKLGQMDKATPFYQMAVNSHLDSEFYYPAYSAFYLGEIYESTLNIKGAISYYNICMQLDAPIYKTEIHKKAKLAKIKLE